MGTGRPRERMAGGKHALGIQHLRTSQLKLLLGASGLSTKGTREELLDRLREDVVGDVSMEWIVTAITEADTPVREDSTLVEKDGELYMFGGQDGVSDIGSQELLRLNRECRSWKVVENIGTWPERRYAHCAVIFDNKMFIWGGQRDCNSDRYFNDMHYFDFKTRVWKEVKQNGNIPEPRSFAKAVVRGKHMLVYGGVDADRGGDAGGLTEFSEGLGTLLQFDFETYTWSQEKAGGPPSTRPLPIFTEAMAFYNSHVYVISYDYQKQDQVLHVYKLDLDKMKWHKIKIKGVAPSARTKMANVVLGRQWIIHGGLQQCVNEEEDGEEENFHDLPTDECWSFSFETETWTQLEFKGRTPLARGGHAACELMGSMVLVGGHVPPQDRAAEDSGDESDASDEEDYVSDFESHDSDYFEVSDREDGDQAGGHEEQEHHAGHAAEHSDESADSISSHGEGSASRSSSLHNDPADLKTIEVLQPRPTGPATDQLTNVDLTSHLKRFCFSESHSDVVLLVENKRFPAHRLVLAAQSDAFDAMFNGGMKEDTTGEVTVEDMRPEVMKSFLSYLYGCLNAIRPDQAMDLFRASDRYGVQSLRAECFNMLQAAIDAQNAAAIAQLADEHNCEQLLNACIRFTANAQDLPKVVGSAAYMDLMRHNPELAQKFLQKAAELQAENGRLAEASHHRRRKRRRRC